jgi:hypothetical protein
MIPGGPAADAKFVIQSGRRLNRPTVASLVCGSSSGAI